MSRKAYSTPEQQAAADKRWNEKNRERRSYLSSRSSSRSFIRNKATMEDLDELTHLIEERKTLLENQSED